jgi:hypothetical protein
MINMDTEVLGVLEQPGTGKVLSWQGESGTLQAEDGQSYPVEDGVIRFLRDDALSGSNAKYQRMYDRFAPLYDGVTRVYARLRSGGEKNRVILAHT